MNSRLDEISSFIVMDIVREANRFSDAIHFEVGQPDLPPAPKVVKELCNIPNSGFGYTPSMGLKSLQEAIAMHYKEVYGVSVDSKNILITPGTSGAFLVAFALACDYSGNLGISDPGYPCYKNISHLLNINPVAINVYKDSNYQITKEHLKGLNLDALQISNPANPTGNIYDNSNLEELIEYCLDNNIAFISDELYHGLTYDVKIDSALKYSDEVFVINGFSKYFCMPGFRVGWLIVPDRFIKKAEEIAQNIFISAPTISQYAAINAFDYEYLKGVNLEFKRRRDYLYNELKDIFKIESIPQGAFYIWADISKYSNDSLDFSKKLLQDLHVATTPGIDFGKNGTNRYIRFAYTRESEHLKEGVERIKRYLGSFF